MPYTSDVLSAAEIVSELHATLTAWLRPQQCDALENDSHAVLDKATAWLDIIEEGRADE